MLLAAHSFINPRSQDCLGSVGSLKTLEVKFIGCVYKTRKLFKKDLVEKYIISPRNNARDSNITT